MNNSLPAYQIQQSTSVQTAALKAALMKQPEVFAVSEHLELAAQIICLGIHREVGTVNDETARFIFDNKLETPVPLSSLKSELINYNHQWGVRIWSTQTSDLDLRAKGFHQLVHPTLSFDEFGCLHSLFIFPSVIEKIARLQGIELTIVRKWALNSVFGNFDPKRGYYQTNYWELENNDALQFSQLLQKGQLAFLGTHDLIAHIAFADARYWPQLKKMASRVEQTITRYLASCPRPTIAALILPYTAGVLLDDLAQPPSYSSLSHTQVLNEVLMAMEKNWIPADLKTVLGKFPQQFEKVIDLARDTDEERVKREKTKRVRTMCKEVLQHSLMLETS